MESYEKDTHKTSTWTNTAGPRQTKAVNDALKAFRWQAQSRRSLTGVIGVDEREALITSMCGAYCAGYTEAYEKIGAAHSWTITRSNYAEIVKAIDAAKAALVLPIDDQRRTPAEANALAEKQRAAQAERKAACDAEQRRRDDLIRQLEARKPANAQALIVAALDEDDCDSMTDYFNVKTIKQVAIGWRTGKREDFRQLRRAAAGFEQTKHLGPNCGVFSVSFEIPDGKGIGRPRAFDHETRSVPEFSTRAEAEAFAAQFIERNKGVTWSVPDYECADYLASIGQPYRIDEEKIEHRDNYSGGRGNYLKAGGCYHSGWRVFSTPWPLSYNWPDEIAIPEPEAAETSSASEVGGVRFKPIEERYIESKGRMAYVVGLVDQVDRPTFNTLKSRAFSIGGGWSRWSQGFSFRTRAMAEAFAGVDAGPDGTPRRDDTHQQASERTPQKTSGAMIAEQLRTKADSMQKAIDHAKRPMTQNPTPKRNREYLSRLHDGRCLEACQKAMRALAELHDRGECPALLANLTTKAAILPLVRFDCDTSGGYYDFRTLSTYINTSETGKALQAIIGKLDTAQSDRARRWAEIQRAKIPGFFPTPPDIAARMAEMADIDDGDHVLDPSMGTGALLKAAKSASSSCKITGIESNGMLYEHAIGDFPSGSFYHADFTEWDGGQFDVILMNPPYERSQDALHLLKAWEHLAPGGRLVALVSPSLPTRQNADTREAAMLIDDAADICEPLPTGCFKSSGTGVTPLLIKLRKPDLDVAERRKDRWARKV